MVLAGFNIKAEFWGSGSISKNSESFTFAQSRLIGFTVK